MAGLELAFADEACALAFSDERFLAAMARFESALAVASARCGRVPAAHAEAIAKACEQARFDAAKIGRESRGAGSMAIPFLQALKAQVRAISAEAAESLHAGATSQDAIDTALVLCLREAARRIDALALRLGRALARLAGDHRETAMAARTLLQPALQISFGYKAAVWLSLVERCLQGFRRASDEAFVLQFGGPAGTLSSFDADADELAAQLAADLSLNAAPIPWHSARDGVARVGAELAILAGAAGKIGRDVSLLMQSEVAEASEPSPGGSSSMPHKRNPAGSMLALEAAHRAPGLAATLLSELSPEHERGLGQWQSQWLTLRELACACASGLASIAEVVEGLKVDAAAMRTNLARAHLPADGSQGADASAAMIDRVLARWAATSARAFP
ncbi:MAG: 3-carboxy-cis,cis-muconate cycloisomerase [Betaproteobacteria bacterium]|nr:3-carboxy-cis,cis-muconate cycloisomerase [Betaproteobacteria bacterium]